MRVRGVVSVLIASTSLPLLACGGSGGDAAPILLTSDDADAGIGADAGPDPSVDAAPPAVKDAGPIADPTYPAEHAPIPLVDWLGGRVVVAPKIVTVTFPGDALKTRLEAFGDVITSTKWWDAVSAGYCAGAKCIGRGTSGGHAVLPAAAPSYTDGQGGAPSTLQDMLKARVADGTLPAPTSDTVYVLYLPSTSKVSMDDGAGGTAVSCEYFAGYHGAVALTPKGGGAPVLSPYAVVARCDASERNATITASHEIIEAATDPDASENDPGYYMTNEVWPSLYGGLGEVGDLCLDITTGDALPIEESGFTVQRSWSNDAARLGHSPCVPVPPGEVYVQAAARTLSTVVAVGTTSTVDLDAFSDGPVADWSIKAIDLGALMSRSASHLTLALDRKTVNNGTTAMLSVTVTSALPGGTGTVAIVSTSKGVSHLWPLEIRTR